jgi:hypothetical protein
MKFESLQLVAQNETISYPKQKSFQIAEFQHKRTHYFVLKPLVPFVTTSEKIAIGLPLVQLLMFAMEDALIRISRGRLVP